MKWKLARDRIESLRVFLWTIPAAKTLAVREELDALCDMALEAEALCEQLESLEGLMNLGDQARLHKAVGEVRIVIRRWRTPKPVLS